MGFVRPPVTLGEVVWWMQSPKAPSKDNRAHVAFVSGPCSVTGAVPLTIVVPPGTAAAWGGREHAMLFNKSSVWHIDDPEQTSRPVVGENGAWMKIPAASAPAAEGAVAQALLARLNDLESRLEALEVKPKK